MLTQIFYQEFPLMFDYPKFNVFRCLSLLKNNPASRSCKFQQTNVRTPPAKSLCYLESRDLFRFRPIHLGNAWRFAASEVSGTKSIASAGADIYELAQSVAGQIRGTSAGSANGAWRAGAARAGSSCLCAKIIVANF
jgi:hypothetical protein